MMRVYFILTAIIPVSLRQSLIPLLFITTLLRWLALETGFDLNADDPGFLHQDGPSGL